MEAKLLDSLTPRERQVFDQTVAGFSREAIGLHLRISVETVVVHRFHLYRKLGVHSEADCVRFAARAGVLMPILEA